MPLVAGTVTRVEPFPEARKPAYKIWVDFGLYGEKKTSAQIASLYRPDDLVGRQIVGVITDGVVVTAINRTVPNGARLA